MSQFDATGGPWGYVFTPAAGLVGLDVAIAAGTFTGQTAPEPVGTIPDQTVYVGVMADGEVYLERHNWYNQGAQLRTLRANYPGYPRVALVDYYHLITLAADMNVLPTGDLDTAPFYAKLADPAITADEGTLRQLWALLSAAAVSDAQRNALAATLGLRAALASLLHDFGVLVREASGAFTDADLAVVRGTLARLPDPIVDQFHLLVFDDTLLRYGASGGYGSGGVIVVSLHSGPGSFVAYPSGRQQPASDSLQHLLMHELGHLMDLTSMAVEENEYTATYNAALGDPAADLYEGSFPAVRTEDIIFYWQGWCNDSRTILDEVVARGNPLLSMKLAHVIDLLPAAEPGKVPFFSTDGSGVTTVRLAAVTRGPERYLGDDGVITSVDGIGLPL